LKTPTIVPIGELKQEPYASILCFPKPDPAELESRIAELQALGVDSLEFVGNSNVYGVGVPVLGKGFVGIVVAAYCGGQRVAVKIRRLDADRADLLHEAQMLRIANAVDVAPRFVAASRNFLVMQLIDGDILPTWLKTHKQKSEVQAVLAAVLEQCYRLDEAGLDQGELSKAPKHVMVDRAAKPWIVDFETASDTRKPSNLTALCNFLFTCNGEVARAIAEILGEPNREKIVAALKAYRASRSRGSFQAVLEACFGGG
jgi:putative serine/threonine protein kinase